MSQTAAVTALAIRRLIDDLDKSDYAISSVRLANIVQSKVQMLATRLIQPMVASPPTTISVLVGVTDYTVLLTVAGIRLVTLKTLGYPLEPTSFEIITDMFRLDSDHPWEGTPPTHYAPYKTNTQLDRIRIGPKPTAALTLNVYKDTFPLDGAGDGSAVPFSTLMLRALEKACALECVATMSAKDREKRMISTDVLKLWAAEVDQAIKDENWQQRMAGGSQERVDEVEA